MLSDHEREGFRLIPTCRACWHAGAEIEPRDLARRFGLSMAAYHPDIERRLVCQECGARKGYLQLLNPFVKG